MKINYLNYHDQTIPYVILKKDNKNTYYRFRKNYLEIAKSKYLTDEEALKFVIKNFDKFYQKYLKTQTKILNDYEITLEDNIYQLVINNQEHFNYEIKDNNIIVNSPFDLNKTKFLIYQNHLNKMVNQINQDINLILNENKIKPLPFRYGHYRSKFGSYHRYKKEITLNVILAKANINYLYYVIMHEYAHVKVFDHSKKFYEVLQKLMPNYREYQKTINKLSIWL